MSKAAWSTLSSEPATPGAGRRALLLGGAGAALAGCGFTPLYGPNGGVASDMRQEIAATRVEYMGERLGVLLKRGLERRIESAGGGALVPAKYSLVANVLLGSEILGYRADGGVTRVRFTATSNWVLSTRTNPPEEIGRGVARSMDAFNVPDFQFFASEVGSEAAQRRLVEELTEQVFVQVAAKLRGWLRPASG